MLSFPEFKRNKQKYVIFCELCVDKSEIEQLNENSTKVIGMISIDKVEEPIEEAAAQPRTFTNFKQLVKIHLGSVIQKAALEDFRNAGRVNKKRNDRQKDRRTEVHIELLPN